MVIITVSDEDIHATPDEVQQLFLCPGTTYIVNNIPVKGKNITKQTMDISSLKVSDWENIIDRANTMNSKDKTLIITLDISSTNSLTHKYNNVDNILPSTNIYKSTWTQIKTKCNIIFVSKGDNPIILGKTSGFENANDLNIISHSLEFSGITFNGVDLNWTYNSETSIDSSKLTATSVPMLTLINGGTVDLQNLVNKSTINCHGDMSTNNFNLTYSNITVDGNLTIDNWAYGPWPVIDFSTTTYTSSSISGYLQAQSGPKIQSQDTPIDINNTITYLQNSNNNLYSSYYTIADLSNVTNVIDICSNIFGKSGNPHYTINNQQNRMFYYTPGISYEFILRYDISQHPVGFVSDNSSGHSFIIENSNNIRSYNYLELSNNFGTSFPKPNIPELSSANIAKPNPDTLFYDISDTTLDGSLRIIFNINENSELANNIFLYCGNHGTMASPLVLIHDILGSSTSLVLGIEDDGLPPCLPGIGATTHYSCEPLPGICNNTSPKNMCGTCSTEADCGGSDSTSYCWKTGSTGTGC